MTLSAVHSLVVIHIDELSRPKKWRLQLFGRKKSMMFPNGCHVLDMRGLIPGVTIPSSGSGSRDDRLTKCSPVRMFIPCRGCGDLFPGRVGKRDQSRGGNLPPRATQDENHYHVLLGDREEATLQLADYFFPCRPACINPCSKLSLGLAAGIAGKRLHRNIRRSRRVPWDLS